MKHVQEAARNVRGKEVEISWNYGPEAPTLAELQEIAREYFPGVSFDRLVIQRPRGDLGPQKTFAIRLTDVW